MDYIRTQLHIPTNNLKDTFYTDLAARSGNSEEDVRKLFKLIAALQNTNVVSKEELQNLNRAIDEFKSRH